MLCSRFSFRLSVRQVVSRVILRGSALHYFAQRPIWAHSVNQHLTMGLLLYVQLAEAVEPEGHKLGAHLGLRQFLTGNLGF